MTKPTMIDLFCRAGGTTRGYQLAGFHVTGVDIEPQPDYVGDDFHQADALTFDLSGFDVLAGSPPCQDHSTLSAVTAAHGTGWMLQATIDRFKATGKPWVVENVGGADLPGELVLCGSEFGLGAMCRDGVWRQLRRHRRFASNVYLMGAGGCAHKGEPVGVYGGGTNRINGQRRGYKGHADERKAAMQITWMNQADLAQAVPPAFTEHVGSQLLAALAEAVA